MDSLVLGCSAILAVGTSSYFAGVDTNKTPTDILSDKRIRAYPFYSALTLVSVNLLFEYFGAQTINFVLMFYFGLTGTNSIWFLLRTFTNVKSKQLFMYPASKSMITEFVLPPKPVPFCVFDILLYTVGLCINVVYYLTRNNIANNIIAFSIAFYAILSIRVEKFTSAAPFLWSLLIYDVFFVYTTDVMSSVASEIQGPVKFQISINGGLSILGLGDLVIPGIFISLCSRFDSFLYKLLGKRTPYWKVGMVGYSIALFFTDFICQMTQSGQPALLFITPAVTIPILVMAFLRKEHYAFLSFSG